MSDNGARQRRSQWVLAGVLVLLATIAGYQMMDGSTTTGMPSSGEGPRADRLQSGGAPPPDVRLDGLAPDESGEPAPARNPFRFGPRAPAPREAPLYPAPTEPARTVAQPAPGERFQPGQAPIPLRFIGTVEAPGVGVIAALSDGTFVFHGQEGDVIDGRYRIVTIGVESIVIEHVEGHGRQTIRLTG